MTDEIAAKLNEVRRLADAVFRPQAELADRGAIDGIPSEKDAPARLGIPSEKDAPARLGIVAENIRLLADLGCFGLGIGREYGGSGADEATRREFTEIVASACGVTAFTQAQLHSGGGFAQSALSDRAKADLLPRFASGELLCGVAYSHLRRPGPPLVTARRELGGFRIDGRAPWVTGWSILDGFMLGASVVKSDPPLEEGVGEVVDSAEPMHLFVYVQKAGNEAVLRAGPPIALQAMNASDTVEVEIDGLFIPSTDVAGERPAEELKRSDYCGITGHVYLPLGCARGSVHCLRSLATDRGDDRLVSLADRFEREIDECRREALTWTGACAGVPNYKERALNARTWAIELAVRVAHAALAATGGSGQMLDRPPQRLMREAMFYTTLAQTADVQARTLARLSGTD